MAMKKMLYLVLFVMSTGSAIAQQKYFSKAVKISFFSKSPLENIEAVNNKGLCVWDVATGQIELSVLMKGFEFEKGLMQEHFNENYVESDKYDKAIFTGTIDNSKSVSFATDNAVTLKVNGSLTMHGVNNPVSTTALITVKNGIVSASANFSIVLADYKISIPSLVEDKINKRIAIAVNVPAFQVLASK